jgi:hypothetical protein
MSTLNEIAYGIMNKVKPRLTDDSDLGISIIKHDIHVDRADLLKKHIKNGNSINDDFIQDLGCLDLEIADAADCCDLSTGCSMIRTVKDIPNNIMITRVGSIVKTKLRFKYTSFEEAMVSGNGRFNNDIIFAFPLNNKIHLKSNDITIALLSKINVRGVFQDPTDVKTFNQCGTDITCYSDDDEYPMSNWMEKHIREGLINTYLKQEQLPTDNANDGKDQSTDQS